MKSKLTGELHAAVTMRNQTAVWMRRRGWLAGSHHTKCSCTARSTLDSVEIQKPGSIKSADSFPTPIDIVRQQKKMATAARP
jgi:hypothetical protein